MDRAVKDRREYGEEVALMARELGISTSHMFGVANRSKGASPDLQDKLAGLLGVPRLEIFTAGCRMARLDQPTQEEGGNGIASGEH